MPTTLVCVPILVEDADAALADAQRARDLGADLVEWRIDRIANEQAVDDAIAIVTSLIDRSPLPSILTCRTAREGGEFDAPDDDLGSLLEPFARPESESPPAHLDLELRALQRLPTLHALLDRAPETPVDAPPRVILSHHDFEGRPARLFETLAQMRVVHDARALKLAWLGRSLRDNLEAFEILLERDRPMIVLVMGEAGLMSRVLAAKFGGYLTFASLPGSAGTAPGQPSITDLLSLYRFRSIGRATSVYGVVGWPVAHSLSPHIHNAAFESIDLDAVYLPMPVAPKWEALKATILEMLDFAPLDLRGLSVTRPHKEHLLRLAREDASRTWSVDPLARRVGAANTLIVSDDGNCTLTNTDVAGIVAPIAGALEERGRPIADSRALVIGAGGAARAAACGLLSEGADVSIAARRSEEASRLAQELRTTFDVDGGGGARIDTAPWPIPTTPDFDILVNCTPIGMGDGADALWIPEALLDEMAREPERFVLMDSVYTPIVTPTVRAAEARKLTALGGLPMFIEQGAAQFEAWTGRPAPRGLMERVAGETMHHRDA